MFLLRCSLVAPDGAAVPGCCVLVELTLTDVLGNGTPSLFLETFGLAGTASLNGREIGFPSASARG